MAKKTIATPAQVAAVNVKAQAGRPSGGSTGTIDKHGKFILDPPGRSLFDKE